MAKKKVVKKLPKAAKSAPVAPLPIQLAWITSHPLVVVAALLVIVGFPAGYAHYRTTKTTANCSAVAPASTAATSSLHVGKSAPQTLTGTTESDLVQNQAATPETTSVSGQNAGTLNQAAPSTLQAPAGTGSLDPSLL